MLTIFRRFSISIRIKQGLLIIFLILCSFSFVSPFSKIPIVGDDLMSSILPNCLMIEPRIDFAKASSLSQMIYFINANTEKDAVFFGSFYIRAGGSRSVVLDGKGSSMIIEGNQPQFITWYLQTEKLNSLQSPTDKAAYLKSLGTNYILSSDKWPLKLVKSIGDQYLYEL